MGNAEGKHLWSDGRKEKKSNMNNKVNLSISIVSSVNMLIY